MRAAVLGYGPAGLIAAKTLVDEGIDVEVIGAGGKSVIGGAQYLHEPILNAEHVTEPEGYIEFLKIGERDGYAKKIYPEASTDVSWDHYEGQVPAWSLGPVYDVLWDHFVDDLIHDTLDWMGLTTLQDSQRYNIIFSSIPAHALCMGRHGFPKVPIKLFNAGPLKVPNTVLYSGRKEDPWYRTSCIFGQAWTEFGHDVINAARFLPHTSRESGDIFQAVPGFKPLGTNCDCHPDVVRIGRFGLWNRKVLLHHVPRQVRTALKERSLA